MILLWITTAAFVNEIFVLSSYRTFKQFAVIVQHGPSTFLTWAIYGVRKFYELKENDENVASTFNVHSTLWRWNILCNITTLTNINNNVITFKSSCS